MPSTFFYSLIFFVPGARVKEGPLSFLGFFFSICTILTRCRDSNSRCGDCRQVCYLGLGIRSFAHFAQIKWETVSKLLRLLTKIERCEQISQIAYQKRAIMSNSLRSLTKNERFAQNTDERIPSPGATNKIHTSLINFVSILSYEGASQQVFVIDHTKKQRVFIAGPSARVAELLLSCINCSY